jgi:chromate transporter
MNASAHEASPEAPAAVSLTAAFWYWFKLGFISFGGPAGQIALMHTDLVERKRWISEQRFLHALNYCMLLPGPEAMQLAVYIGWLMHRSIGGIIAGVLFVLPSLIILIALSWIYLSFGDLPIFAGILFGIKPAIVVIVLAAALRIGSRSLQNRWLIGIASLAFIAITLFQCPFPLIVLIAALFGIIGSRVLPNQFQIGSGHSASKKSSGPALIDDHTSSPDHAQFKGRKFFIVVGVGLTLGLSVWGILIALTSWSHTLAQMSWFFTKAAMLTFGGAYAVLPYVYQGSVTHFEWLSPEQMIDGLALGETTPGPLIMIVAFVGFVGGWSKEIFGASHLLLAGVAGATVATFFTFLPSFIFILAGAPLVEATRNNITFTAPLTAISAAVVGVILSLAVFFAEHVFHISEPLVNWDLVSISIAILAALALWRFKLSTIKLIALCALAGLVVSYLPLA